MDEPTADRRADLLGRLTATEVRQDAAAAASEAAAVDRQEASDLVGRQRLAADDLAHAAADLKAAAADLRAVTAALRRLLGG